MLIKKPRGAAMVDDDDAQFRRFWDAYPRRCAKQDARRAWMKLNPDIALVDCIIHALLWQVLAHHWDSDKADYAPYPATWLNGRRWEDEGPRAPAMLSTAVHDPMQAWLSRKKVVGE